VVIMVGKRAVLGFDLRSESGHSDSAPTPQQRGFEIVHEDTDKISGAKAKRPATRPDVGRGPPLRV
jgi:hypothetical protein